MLDVANALLDLLPTAVVMASVYLFVYLGRFLFRRGHYIAGELVYYLPILLLLGAAVVLIVEM